MGYAIIRRTCGLWHSSAMKMLRVPGTHTYINVIIARSMIQIDMVARAEAKIYGGLSLLTAMYALDAMGIEYELVNV
jgi:hypothetical protein